MFSLSADAVHSTISKMMIKVWFSKRVLRCRCRAVQEEITAFWDESSKYVLVQHSEPTPLQRLAITLAERAVQARWTSEQSPFWKMITRPWRTTSAWWT